MTGKSEDFHIRNTFSKNLRKILDQLDLNAMTLARRAGDAPTAVYSILRSSRDPSLTTIVKILKVIPTPFESFLKEVE